MSRLWGGLVVLLFLLLAGCETVPETIPPPHPPGFVAMVIPSDNPLTEAGVALGRQLFYDPILSLDSTISCGSCHRPELAFTDGQAISRGIAGQAGRRSAPSLLNIGFHYKGVFWDGRSPNLEDQALHPLGDSLEMGANWARVARRLNNHPDYPGLYAKAFGQADLSKEQTARALAQFQRTLISANSKYDQVQRGEARFTPQEQRGWTIFFDAGYPTVPMAECSHCHTEPLFTNLEFANNGLDSSQHLQNFRDQGLGAVTGSTYDNGKFRVPTLRNITQTAPYMHDGRFAKLDEVIDHYNTGGQYAENVDPNVRPLHLNEQDKADLLAFLATLTDTFALNNPAYYPLQK
ncbi:MAG: hypothetical protein DA408_11855 [Bacteroidetes bacterium]|nr:MAG: hypothetical protein DA408_11855 [Bacteroidota bacterium]